MPHIGGFTSHVGASNDRNQVFPVIQQHIIRHKGGIAELLYHRVTAALNINAAAHIYLRTAVALPHRHLGQGGQNIQPGQKLCRGLDTLQVFRNRAAHSAEKLVFQRHRAILGTQHPCLQFFQLLGDIAFGIGQRLLADIFRRHLVGILPCDLYVVAKHPVVPNLQRFDAGLFFLAGLNAGNDALAVSHIGAQLIQLGIKARTDHAALPHGKRRIFHNGGSNQLLYILQQVHPLRDIPQQLRVSILQAQAKLRQALQRLLE